MRSTALIALITLGLGLSSTPSHATVECELFLYSGVTVEEAGVGPAYDPAGEGCWLPGGPHDTSVLTPGALDVSGLVWAESTSTAPTHARIVFRDATGAESRTEVTFVRLASRGYFTTEHVAIPPTATTAVIEARFGDELHVHEYLRLPSA